MDIGDSGHTLSTTSFSEGDLCIVHSDGWLFWEIMALEAFFLSSGVLCCLQKKYNIEVMLWIGDRLGALVL
jgi:hypothetical protein